MGARDSMETDDGVAELNAVTLGPVAVLLAVAAARDYCAENGRFPAAPNGPGPDQCFDDWAADLSQGALSQMGVEYPGPDLLLPIGQHGWTSGDLKHVEGLVDTHQGAESAAQLLLDYHVKCATEEYTDSGVAWEVMAEVYGKLTGGKNLDADSLAVREAPDKLIRADVCLTLKVPAGTRIDESGGIILPDGSELIPATRSGMVEHVEHIYHTTPVEVAELYEGNDH